MARDRADYSIPLDEGLDEYDNAEANALGRLDETKLSFRDEIPKWVDGSDFDGRIPSNLSSLDAREIGEYYNLMIEFTDYVSGQCVLGRTAMLAATEKLKLTKAAVRKTKTGTVQQKEDSTLVDARYVEANAAYIEAKCFYELLERIEKSARRDCAFISRIIETKKLEFERGRRSGSIGSRAAANRFRVDGDDEKAKERKRRRTTRRRRRSL